MSGKLAFPNMIGFIIFGVHFPLISNTYTAPLGYWYAWTFVLEVGACFFSSSIVSGDASIFHGM